MTNKKKTQSPELAGGDGFTYEGHVMAFYLTALLAESSAPGCDGIVTNVASQQRDFGYPLDDVIVKWRDASDQIGTTSLQVKRDLTISSADTNKNFRDVIRDSLSSYQKSGFNEGSDKYGVAVSKISSAKFRDLGFLCQIAVESDNIEHFERRFKSDGNASAEIITIKEAIYQLLDEFSVIQLTPTQKHDFLKHFVIVRFDFLHDGEVEPHIAEKNIQSQLATNSHVSPVLVWSHIYELGRESAGKAGQFDRVRLVHELSKVVWLKEGRTFEEQFEKIKELTNTYLNQIQSDINGYTLDRSSLKTKFFETLERVRFVQITGMPGTGKSALLRQIIEKYLDNTLILFLKSDQLVGKNWAQYAQSSGIPATNNLKELLVEIQSAGIPILFIDGIDRVDSQHRFIIEELVALILNDPLLTQWKIVVTLRETGLEPLRTWLGSVLKQASIGSITVDKLDDNEANILGKQFPNIRRLLFSPSENVKHVVRTPFFARILSILSLSDDTSPESELDLIHEWWKRGGYSAISQKVINRQNTLLDLAEHKVKKLTQAVKRRSLASNLELDDLNSDGVIRIDDRKPTVDFTHDIFFEWSLLYSLLEADDEWLDKIEEFGQPPAIARVVELLSQQKLKDEEWTNQLDNPKFKTLRSQWMRAWLLGAISYPNINQYSEQLKSKLAENDYAFYEKLLVWFQAEKTQPNPLILSSSNNIKIATSLAWPTDLTLWLQTIVFILGDIATLPENLYPQVVDIFTVFQNLAMNFEGDTQPEIINRFSSRILEIALGWLSEIEGLKGYPSTQNWKLIDDLLGFKDSLRNLIIRSASSNPTFFETYLTRLLSLDEIPNELFKHVIQLTGLIAKNHADLMVKFCLKKVLYELPLDKYNRECVERQRSQEYWTELNNIPADELTNKQKEMLQRRALFLSPFQNDIISDSDWKNLALNSDFIGFYPPSPIKEPYYSLLKNSPEYGLRLIRELSNHAITAWKQLHGLSDNKMTPIPIELNFPWGSQTFWGNEKEYIWSRAYWANDILSTAFMTLEKWCFEQLEAGVDLEALIQRITQGHESVAILSVVSVLALEQQFISKSTLPLVTNQKVLDLDYYRYTQDLGGSSTPLISYEGKYLTHKKDIDEIKKIYTKVGYQSYLSSLLTAFVFSEFSAEIKTQLNEFKNSLPYDFEEQVDNTAVTERLLERASFYAEYADETTYSVQPTENDNIVTISHHSPSSETPESIERFKVAQEYQNHITLAMWAKKSLEENNLNPEVDLIKAIYYIKTQNNCDIDVFKDKCDGWSDEITHKRMKQNAISAVATMALYFREGVKDTDLVWAREIIDRVMSLPFNSYECSTPDAQLMFHPKLFATKALVAEIRHGIDADCAKTHLLSLIVSPVNEISLLALNCCTSLYHIDAKLSYSALFIAISLCYNHFKYEIYNSDNMEKVNEKWLNLIATIDTYYESEEPYLKLPRCDSPWVELEKEKYRPSANYYFDKSLVVLKWERSEEQWDTNFLAKVLKTLPTKQFVESKIKEEFLSFLEDLLNWTIELIEPNWSEDYNYRGDRSSLYDFLDSLGYIISILCGKLSYSETFDRFVQPLLALETKEGWELIQPLISYLSCHFYDEAEVSNDVIRILERCLERFLQEDEFDRNGYKLNRFDLFKTNTLKSLMFTSIGTFKGAKRFANGDWSDIDLILPIIDKIVREAGWISSVMHNYIELCENAKEYYPAELFADQVLTTISQPKLVGWQGSTLYSRIAELVQFFAERDNPLNLVTGQKLLRIVDWLIDQGDRRSASLQQSELFRSIKLN